MTERKRLNKNKGISLTAMTPKELKQLRAKVDFLITNTSEDTDNPNYQIFYELLTDRLYTLHHTKYPPYPIFKKTKQQHKKLLEVVDYLDGLLEDIFAEPKRLYYRKMYRLYVTLVIENIANSPLPVEIPIILNFKNKFVGILDNNFPGYLENGLFKVIFLNKL